MADVFPKEKRSDVMSRIKGKSTKPERIVRSLLHRLGYRFRLHHPDLPGKPDIVLTKYKTIVFVHGCFWHRHEGCRFAYTPKTNRDFWIRKFEANTARDRCVQEDLTGRGWRVVTIWECELRRLEDLVKKLNETLTKHNA